MPATTLAAILARFKTVLEASPLSLKVTNDPYGAETIANTATDTAVQIQAGGLVSEKPQGGDQWVRIDRVNVVLFRKMAFDGHDAQNDLQTLLDSIEARVIADGTNNSYEAVVEKGSRKVTRKKDSDVLQATVAFQVDYDFSKSV